MKIIKSIKQLKTEKKLIKQQEEQLESDIRENWNELKVCLKPVNIAKEAMGKVIRAKTEENVNGQSVLKSTFIFGITLLAKRFANKAGEILHRIFRK